ncbi:hypothetical protein HGM15179_012472 [Zosterops borbonicus]|uniref:Rna-directed dna polymerase from mobile element jockey-like n=1 Tax=Zosterops borbonicus TaxID=364589 RepID=A0A8K1G9S8_9PASS|nr:hypothetical protein HGM15179_012472 [Zosterops borbonicus]
MFSSIDNDIDKAIEHILRKSTDDTKLSGTADTPEGWDAIQRDLDKLKKWAHGNPMRFNKIRCQVLHLGWSKAWYQHSVGMNRSEQPCPEGLGGAGGKDDLSLINSTSKIPFIS